MKEFFLNLFSSDFMSHGYCYNWNPDIVWLHAVSDSLIAFSYYLIPILLVYFVRKRRDVPFNWMFVMFGVFIFGCGTTHVMEIWTLWHGTYRLAGLIKAITAGASLVTAAALFPMIPKALALPGPEVLRIEIADRKRAEEALNEANATLECRVQERTADLQRANEKQKETEASLRQSERELQSLASRLISVQEDERKRIARDLHDDLSQRLALHCVQLDLLRQSLPASSETALTLAQLKRDADELTVGVREISHNLHHLQLSLGLQHGAATFCGEFSRQHGIAVDLTHEGDLHKVPESVSVVLFRVLQEALGNVAKHSGADRVGVFLSADGDQARMQVTDRGLGFENSVSQNGGGLGLVSMRERLRLVGGSMNLTSSPGQGTEVDVVVPIRMSVTATSTERYSAQVGSADIPL
jgi:signal transduction histidine kinase